VDTVLKENPDVVVVATGSTPRLPYDIEGIDQDNVVNVRDVLTGKVETGQNVLVVDARPYIEGLTTADFLAERGKTVEVVTAYSYQQGKNVDEPTRAVLMARLLGKGVKITSDTMLIKISGNDVTVAGCFTGVESVIEGIDTVVLSFGSVENNSLYYDLKGKVKELYAVGDCWGVRKIMWATNDGATLARQI
jgi:pyruvate/2-oxoglutarate dehydrogenase complex dihydrolipoamide dehydrogenase (E3) component